MASIIEPKILKGFRDSLPQAEIPKKQMIRTLESMFENSGFVPIDTPALEYTEVLLGKGGGETDKQVYRFNDNGGRDVSLRFDLTVPFARFMAKNRSSLYLPFKRYHINKVWRGENTQKGRYREFYQCDFDIVGTTSLSSDLEILLMMHSSLKALGVDDFTIHLNHRGMFNALLDTLGISEKNVFILRTVDKINKIGTDKVKELLIEQISSSQADKLLDFIKSEEGSMETLIKMEKLCGGENEYSLRLREILTIFKEMNLEKTFKLDPSITRGLDYYTGIVFETLLDKLPRIGSVCSGGRYDNLAGLYTKEALPGVGASIGLDRLLAGLEDLKIQMGVIAPAEILVMNFDKDLLGHYHSLCREIKAQGISAEVYPENKKLAQQFKFAENKGIPIALICGGDEKEKGVVGIKNLNTKESFNDLSLEGAVLKVKELLHSS